MSAPWPDVGPDDDRIVFTPTPYDDPVATALVESLQALYASRYGGGDTTPVHAAEFGPPYGLFLVGRLGGVPMCCGGWRLVPAEPGLAEMKRLYVLEGYRRRGLARVALAELEATARAAGVRRFRLETGYMQPEAKRLYETSGYDRIPNYGIYAEGTSTCFAKDL